MKKYYFITYVTKRLGRQFLDSNVIDEHPFNWLNIVQYESNNKVVLIGWREISEEEYNMFDKDGTKVDSVQTETSRANPNSPIEFCPPDQGGLEG